MPPSRLLAVSNHEGHVLILRDARTRVLILRHLYRTRAPQDEDGRAHAELQLARTLMLRSRALSAFTRVFNAPWRAVSKHEGGSAAPSFETRARTT